jgi:hypothetical protein
MGLLEAFKQYVRDASPGGLLNPEVPIGGPTELAKGLLGFTPVVGDAISAYDAVQSARKGDYLGAALNGIGALPLVPAMGGILKKADLAPHLKRADLAPNGPHFGQWTLKDVEKRTRLEEILDPITGEAKVKRVADLENGEDSWGSGQRVANIYWMEHKGTKEIRPFGDDTAHYAMGVDSRAAKKKFDEAWSLSQDKWLQEEAAKYGFQSYPQMGGRVVAYLGKDPQTGKMTPGAIANLREWLVTDKLSRDQVSERLAKYFAGRVD